MKTRKYDKPAAIYFCPSCHRQMDLPFKGVNFGGTIKIGCNCMGGEIVIVMPEGKGGGGRRAPQAQYCAYCRSETVHNYIKGMDYIVCSRCYVGSEELE